MTEFYSWTPTNSAEVIAFANHVRGLTDQNAMLTLTDDPDATEPATPAAPTLVVNSHTAIAATWVEPDDGGDPITSYDLQYKRTVDSVWTEISDQTDLTETVTGLSASTSYDFQVRATNGIGDSLWSATAQATTQAAPDLMPSLAAVADQDVVTGVAVNFQLPLATGGDGPLTYTATPLPAGLTFDDSTRRVTGTPTTVQTVTTTYRVEDFDGDADSVDFDWNVTAPLTARRPSTPPASTWKRPRCWRRAMAERSATPPTRTATTAAATARWTASSASAPTTPSSA